MRASVLPMKAVLGLLAVFVLALPTSAWSQTGELSVEAMTRLEALDRVTQGQGPATCFTRQQAMAVETQRVYAEILVSALACEADYGLADGYETYVAFSNRQGGLILETQGVLEQYLGSTPAYDAYVSRLANQQSQMLSDFGTHRYCEIHRSRFDSLINASPSSVRNYMEDLAGRLLARQRGC